MPIRPPSEAIGTENEGEGALWIAQRRNRHRERQWGMPCDSQDLPALQAIARRQGGVVSDADLRRCGFSTDATARRIREGRWQRVGGATVITAATPLLTQDYDIASPSAHPTSRGRHPKQRRTRAVTEDPLDLSWAHILQYTYGEGSIISGALALRRAKWPLPAEEFIVVAPHRVRHPLPDVTVLRREPARYRRIDALTFADPIDAFCDLLITTSPGRRWDLVDVALQRRLVTAEKFQEWISPRLGRGKTGATILRTALDRMATGSRSEAEQRMARLLARSGTGSWVPNHLVRGQHGRIIAEIDFALLDLYIAIEVDGRAHHSDRHSFEHDRARQNDLTLRGWLVLRFTWEQITGNPEWVIATIEAAIEQRRHLLRAN